MRMLIHIRCTCKDKPDQIQIQMLILCVNNTFDYNQILAQADMFSTANAEVVEVTETGSHVCLVVMLNWNQGVIGTHIGRDPAQLQNVSSVTLLIKMFSWTSRGKGIA